MAGCPIRLSRHDYDYIAAPLLGQHNEEVYGKWLGLSPEDLDSLRAEKII